MKYFPRRTVLLALLALTCPTLATAQSEPVELYILSGQSNMQGVGKLADASEDALKPNPNALFWNGKAFEPLVPGKTRTSSRPTDFGPEVGFARAFLAKAPDRRIYIVKVHRSGQPLHHGWNGGRWVGGDPGPKRRNFYPGENADDPNIGTHYRDLRNASQAAVAWLKQKQIPFTLRGVCWMQGEADAKHEVSATQYAQSLKRLKARLEADLDSPPAPFVFGQVLPHEPALPRFTHRTEIRQAMANADNRSGHNDAIPGVWMVPTEGMPLNSDTVHYNTEGQLLLGKAMAITMMKAQAADAKK